MSWASYKFVHPGTLKQGYLVKSPPLEKRGLKGWKKRWCMFVMPSGEQPSLHYYKDEAEAFCSLPLKRVSLRFCLRVEADLVHSNYKNVFAIHLPERIYYFSAPSRVEMMEWAETLCTHLKMSCDSIPHMNGSHLMVGSQPQSPQNRSKTLPVPVSLPPPPDIPIPPIPGAHRTHQAHTHPRSPSPRARSPSPLPPSLNRPLPELPGELAPPPVPVRRHSPVNTPPLSLRFQDMPPPPPIRSHSANEEGNIYLSS